MKHEKDILSWFKRNAEQANESPDQSVWNRLENELHESKPKPQITQWWKLAAGVAALLFISLLVYNPFTTKSTDVNLAENDASIETLDAEIDKSKMSRSAFDSVSQIANEDRTEQLAEAKVVEESFASGSVSKTKENEADLTSSESGMADPAIVQKTEAPQPIALEPVINEQDELGSAMTEPIMTAPSNEEFAEPEEEVEEMEVTANDITVLDVETAVVLEDERIQAKEQSISGNSRNKKVAASKSSPLSDRMSGTPANQSGSVGLDWMVGEWQEIKSNETIVENWTRVSEQELVGEGYAISNNDTIFYEQLKISSFNGQVILQMQIDQASPPVNFQLVRNDGNIAVFNNYEIEFPNEIVYERLGNDLLNATFRSAQSNGSINDSNYVGNRNINYLQQRNNLSNTEMYRNMRRNTY